MSARGGIWPTEALLGHIAVLERQLAVLKDSIPAGRREALEWILAAEQMPEVNVPVLAYAVGCYEGAVKRIIRATYVGEKSLETINDDDSGEYDEKTDTYWCPVGWYETNVFEETHWKVEGVVTHWMPLPPAPEATP